MESILNDVDDHFAPKSNNTIEIEAHNIYYEAPCIAPNDIGKLWKMLGLTHVVDPRVGGKNIRGFLRRERRRISIGMDVIHDPAVLLLDEPTSGLYSNFHTISYKCCITWQKYAHEKSSSVYISLVTTSLRS
ncbi:hypothetical protein GOP47_0027902 [Adiantum capillus-veneris]|nr:hypothetical protein GOP47_0027902 [Adiantum capillus-veneris]